MRHVLTRIETRKREAAHHPLFVWLRDDRVAPLERLAFAPVFVTFILGFRDMNRWFLRYPKPADAYERAISAHTREDASHATLFLEDFKKLGFDSRLGWTASDTIAWYYAASETRVFREFAMEILGYCARDDDPFFRFALMESIEACGHVFFTACTHAADAYQSTHGIECRYFGAFHLAREMGHVIGAERLFNDVALDGAGRERAGALVDRIFDMFSIECDHLLAFAQRGLAESPPPHAARAERHEAVLPPIHAAALPLREVVDLHPSQRQLARRLAERKAAAEAHPFFAWMQANDRISARHKLQRFIPLWIPDVMGYRDLSGLALSYPHPASARERAIQRRTMNLETHYELFLRDWRSLDMDGVLCWSASDTLAFCALNPQTELQRSSMADFVKLAFRHPEPLLRYWLIQALEASGEAFFLNTTRLARRVEIESGVRLDYLANRHDSTHPLLEPDPEADAVCFAREALDAEGAGIASEMIDGVFRNLERQFSLSLTLARENFFGVALAAE